MSRLAAISNSPMKLAKTISTAVITFYTMRSEILFVVASLILVGAIIAVLVPSEAHANTNWRYCVGQTGPPCFDNNGACKQAIKDVTGENGKCSKLINP